MEYEKCCRECGTTNWLENHHIIYKSQQKQLEHCKKNQIWLCHYHHRDGKNGIHFNIELQNKYRTEFREWLEGQFTEPLYTPGEIQKLLGINVRSTEKFLKLIPHKCYLYESKDIIGEIMKENI